MLEGRIYFHDLSLKTVVPPNGGELSGADKLAIGRALDGLGIESPGDPG